jgi:SulP family sulfate permease
VLPLRRYDGALLRRDLLAGLTVATVAVPQALAYALLAGVPPVYGLYTAFVLIALGSLFGSSVYLVNGPTNAISLVVFGLVAGVGTGPDDPNRIGLVSLLAVLAGLVQIAIALLGLGALARHVSEAVVHGFLAGAGLLVALTQVPTLLGLPPLGTGTDLVWQRLRLTLTLGGPADLRSLGIGLAALALVVGLSRLGTRLKMKLPDLLLVLVLVSWFVWLFGLAPAGELIVPAGLPTPRLPWLSAGLPWQQLGTGALAIALLGLVEALTIARSLAERTGESLDCNRQCLAEGLANLGGGFFQCLPGSGSLSRSALNHAAGAATRLSGVFAAAAITLALGPLAALARFIPRPALAGVLLWTAFRIVDPPQLWRCLSSRPSKAVVVLTTATAAVLGRVEFSVLIGTALSLGFRLGGRLQEAHEQPA